jgi:hypothetical protein
VPEDRKPGVTGGGGGITPGNTLITPNGSKATIGIAVASGTVIVTGAATADPHNVSATKAIHTRNCLNILMVPD